MVGDSSPFFPTSWKDRLQDDLFVLWTGYLIQIQQYNSFYNWSKNNTGDDSGVFVLVNKFYRDRGISIIYADKKSARWISLKKFVPEQPQVRQTLGQGGSIGNRADETIFIGALPIGRSGYGHDESS